MNPVLQNCNVVIFQETWLNEDEQINLPNFNCIIQCKRNHVRAGGVAIYRNKKWYHQCPHNTHRTFCYTVNIDICISACHRINGPQIVIIYISPNSSMNDITAFLHSSLLRYTRDGGKLLSQRNELKPLILTGDFNINFAS